MTPHEAAQHFHKVSVGLLPAVMAEEKVTATLAKASAVLLSSGPHSTAHLRAAGHPYARRAPNAAYDAAIINVQTGSFRSAWQTAPPSGSSSRIVCGVVNRDKAARYMTGTAKMIERPIQVAVQTRVMPARIKRISTAISRLFQP